ncbi:MAG: phage portal protein [Roseibium sp.]|nr:phage portal protein [Roseibium sp.]
MTEHDQALSVLHETIAAPMDEQKGQTADGRWVPNYWQTFSEIVGLSSKGKKSISFADAIQVAAVSICLDVISQDIAKTPFRLMRRTSTGKQVVMPKEHWLSRLLATEPNAQHTWVEFLEMAILHLALMQNAFIAKLQTKTGEVKELVPIVPGRVTIHVNEDRSNFVYEVAPGTEQEVVHLRSMGGLYRSDQIVHIRGRMFDGLHGLSTLSAGASTMSLAKEVNDFMDRLYANDAQMRGVFEMEADAGSQLDEKSFQRLRHQLSEAMTNFRRQAKPLVLEGGLKFKDVSMKADEAEVSKAFDAAIVNVCRLFRVPPHKAMHLNAVKYENLDAMEKSYVSDTLHPICTRFEQRLSRDLLTPEEREEFFLEFDREAMALSDAEKQAKVAEVGLKYGGLMIDEWREIRGKNPLPDGAGRVRLMPSNFTVVDEKGQVLIEAAGKAGEGSDESGDGDEDQAAESSDKNVFSFRNGAK